MVGNFHPTSRVSTKQAFAEYPLRHSMDLVELGARSMDLVDLEFLELRCLAGKKWSGAVFVDLELRGALPNTPLLSRSYFYYSRQGKEIRKYLTKQEMKQGNA
jgi:hypothetical protein